MVFRLLHTESLTDFCSVDHKLADALKLVAKIIFYKNTIPPAASIISSTNAHKLQTAVPSLKAQIKENTTQCFFPCLPRPVFPRFD